MNPLLTPLCRWEADARNGQSPSSRFYASAVAMQNYGIAYRTRQVFARSWTFGDSKWGQSGTRTWARWRFKSRYGASRLRAHVILGLDQNSGGAGADPRCEISVTDPSGPTTSTVGPFYYGQNSNGGSDAPDNLAITNGYTPIDPATEYECALTTYDYVRVLSVMVHEEIDATVDPGVDYYNGAAPAIGMPIYDSLRERLLAGGVATWKQGGGTLIHLGSEDDNPRTRTTATHANIYTGTTGAPVTTEPGFYVRNVGRRWSTATTNNYEFSCYASTAAGSGGEVVLTSAAGVDYAVISSIGTTSQWRTTTCALPQAETWFGVRFKGDGANQLRLWAASLIEVE